MIYLSKSSVSPWVVTSLTSSDLLASGYSSHKDFSTLVRIFSNKTFEGSRVTEVIILLLLSLILLCYREHGHDTRKNFFVVFDAYAHLLLCTGFFAFLSASKYIWLLILIILLTSFIAQSNSIYFLLHSSVSLVILKQWTHIVFVQLSLCYYVVTFY